MQSGPEKRLVLVGILSRSLDNECAGAINPTLFIDVRKEAEWIHKMMEVKDDAVNSSETLVNVIMQKKWNEMKMNEMRDSEKIINNGSVKSNSISIISVMFCVITTKLIYVSL